ncbi:hypothetical protein Leryth_009549 [Lithospermum erythrorhizon]|nr:hypothetical protein Leryth_009549 [Lithospermum erythrorhizon]
MKTIELLCASPASTAICSSMEQYSMVRHGMKQIDHHTHRLGDRVKTRTRACLSELPFEPRPSFNQKPRKCPTKQSEIRRKRLDDIGDIQHSPHTSSRYLLSESNMVQSSLLDLELSSSLVLYKSKSSVNERVKAINNYKELAVFRSSPSRSSHESPVHKLPSTTLASGKSNDIQVHKSSSTPTGNKVVELRVSIHCKGCEGKVRKHLSKMEGVKSFSIDLVSKKVTVEGNVTPLGVLASISKVKNAQFWPSPTSSSSSSTSSSSLSSSSMSTKRA